MSPRDSIEKDSRDLLAFYEGHTRRALRDWLGTEPRIHGRLNVKEARHASKVTVTGEGEAEIERGMFVRVAFEVNFKIGDSRIYTDPANPFHITLLPENKHARNRLHLLEMCRSRRR